MTGHGRDHATESPPGHAPRDRLGWRALGAVLLMPVPVALLVPLLVFHARAHIAHGAWPWLGVPLLLVGAALFAWCVRDLATTGKGTLAPWDPPRALVASGPYRVSRNPMYLGVLLVLMGWAVLFRSSTHALYAAAIAVAFHLRVVLGEEPWLARTHGEHWTRYAARVPRWLGARQPRP